MAKRSVRGLFYFLCCWIIFCTGSSYSLIGIDQSGPYKQIRIPLDKKMGVPFKEGQLGEYIVEEFDIDSNETYYFLGGEKATLACFSKNGKSIYRKSFSNYIPSQTYI